ncbi:hypothetical protein HVTV-2_gp173 [Haloarcula virus HVTV-2]|uniref:Uncharacterized protein n=1 Tax=Haloarcula vallismortis tailed virus 1 TaxID=1262528 RepID=L7TKM8_9CAUD|nr:hypothetical protein HVTV1_171 [Haloarcula vallismortis tailed virus 1]AGC34540.1 hypothetical protein HVTV1_171 [Haloarcula vallismortis tailed virus 1]UBF22980.1 hypothetical protein HVTV-2_gp173 [Haloarcula virus HVTV-2]
MNLESIYGEHGLVLKETPCGYGVGAHVTEYIATENNFLDRWVSVSSLGRRQSSFWDSRLGQE